MSLIIQTAKLNGVNPMTWLTNVLERVLSGRTKAHELHIPLPWNWIASKDNYKKSQRDLDEHEGDTNKQKSLIAAGAKYNEALVATHSNVFGAMVAAHTKLHNRLAGDQAVTLADVSAAAKDFAIRVAVLQKALASLPTK